ncbi:hypothetical protein [Pseudomonas phage PlaquesPlease]|uniref:Uncharacterized protein n=1 Tax=Pseudomonas phage PlaquesPlease TaxID=2762289 RepID=A0A7G8LJR5_9CAUD|nr:hypothetical protein [Pseudomonas phage PlaquesPlease]
MVNQPHKTETVTINGKEFKTRHWYMDCAKDLTGAERHRIYYAQFVTPSVLEAVKRNFGPSQWAMMAKSYADGDKYLNDCTRLVQWDRCDVRYLVGRLVTECAYIDPPKGTFYWSPSENTCITKEAARILIESGEYPQ